MATKRCDRCYGRMFRKGDEYGNTCMWCPQCGNRTEEVIRQMPIQQSSDYQARKVKFTGTFRAAMAMSGPGGSG